MKNGSNPFPSAKIWGVMMMFVKGQRVVCVFDGEFSKNYGLPQPVPKLGAIYTVAKFLKEDGVPLVMLHEISNKSYPDGAYWAERFAPIQEKKTDISLFQTILKETKTPEKV
jgi:hypothetical protein